MNNLIVINEIIKEKVKNTPEGDLVLKLFEIAEELGICAREEEIENIFSMAVLDYVKYQYKDMEMIKVDHVYRLIKGVYYVVELYIRGYYNEEHYITYEEFLDAVKNGKSRTVIITAGEVFHKHINRLKKIISKTKKRIPRESMSYYETKLLLNELESDLGLCEYYPTLPSSLPENMAEFCFGRIYGLAGATTVKSLKGFLNLEKMVYSLYNELTILSKLNPKDIDKIVNRYNQLTGMYVPYNLFEKVMNNYLLAIPYSDSPEDLKITNVDAKLLINEIKMGTLDADELTEDIIARHSLEGYNAEYLREYSNHLQKRIDLLRNASYFGELFIVSPPE